MNIYSEDEVTRAQPAMQEGQAQWLLACSHVPSVEARRVFNVVFRSGHFRARPGEGMQRRGIAGHEFFYCVSGRGEVRSEAGLFPVEASDVIWLSAGGTQWADQQAPWEVLWMRVDGHQIEQAWEVLSVQERPVFGGLPKKKTQGVFHRVNKLLAGRSFSRDAALNCEVAQLLGYLVENRASATARVTQLGGQHSSEVSFAMEQMFGDLKRSWRAGELAKLCGLSERHFFRRFKWETGTSPIDWLRQQRIRLAQRKLLDGAKRVKEVCEEVGYHDVFFFSRDFKRHTGSSPSHYRREHLRNRLPAVPRRESSGHLEE